jgi:N-acetylmuramoyl-L-alanine amidase
MARAFGDINIPVRDTLESMGLVVSWDNETNVITVTEASEPIQTLTEAEIYDLQRIVFAEANGEDLKGQILVANVVLNRLKSDLPDFRQQNTLHKVLNAYRQFTPIENGAFERAKPNEVTKQAVQMALAGVDYSQGALWFRQARNKQSSWHKTRLIYLFTHGGHAFFGL